MRCLLTDQNFPIHQSHVYGRIKILRTIFEKGHPRNILVKLLQIGPAVPEKILKNCLKKIPFRCHGNQSFWWNQILWTIFKEDLPRNIPAKFGPNWPRCLGGKDVYNKMLTTDKGWLVVLGFNATLTAKIISWRSVTHMCFLALSYQY